MAIIPRTFLILLARLTLLMCLRTILRIPVLVAFSVSLVSLQVKYAQDAADIGGTMILFVLANSLE